jgi:hypothetical protein
LVAVTTGGGRPGSVIVTCEELLQTPLYLPAAILADAQLANRIRNLGYHVASMKSCGTSPKTPRGKAPGNTRRLGLSLSILADPALSEQAAALTCAIAGEASDGNSFEPARRIAEAQIDLRRIPTRVTNSSLIDWKISATGVRQRELPVPTGAYEFIPRNYGTKLARKPKGAARCTA